MVHSNDECSSSSSRDDRPSRRHSRVGGFVARVHHDEVFMRAIIIVSLSLCASLASRTVCADEPELASGVEGPPVADTAEHAPAAAASKPEPPVGWQLESGIASTYVFRGRSQYLSRRDPSSQTTVAATLKKIGPGDVLVGAWNATALSGAAPRPQPGTALEVDLTAGYGMTFGEHVAASAGYTSYLYPKALPGQHLDGAHELYATLSITDAFVTPMVAVYPEVVRLHGAYAMGGLSKTLTLGSVSLTSQASAGVAGYEGAAAHLNDLSAALVAQWTFLGSAYTSGRIAYSYMGGRGADLPTHVDTFAGRSVPWAMLAIGMQQ
jgi:hypothetical protein